MAGLKSCLLPTGPSPLFTDILKVFSDERLRNDTAYVYPLTLPARACQEGDSKMAQSKIKKRSIIINGHKTSISLEDEFWDELRALASERRVPVAALVNEIDQATEGNLSSAIRVYLLMRAQRRSRAA